MALLTKAFTPQQLEWVRGQLDFAGRQLSNPEPESPRESDLVRAVNALRLVVLALVELQEGVE